MKWYVKGPLEVLSSFGLALILLGFLFLLTLLGTLEQANLGLYEVQRKYFTSFFLVHELGPLKVPLPGVYLLLILLAINLTLGVVYRTRPRLDRFGIYVMHGGMLFMLLAGLVTHHFATEGQMTLAPGESSNRFQSYHEWELLIRGPIGPGEAAREYAIPGEDFLRLGRTESRTFVAETLPFDVTVSDVARNAVPQRLAPEQRNASGMGVDGFYLAVLAPEKENERNLPGFHVTLTDKRGGERTEEIVWGGSTLPLEIAREDGTWQLAFRRKSWAVPFTLTLAEFRHEYHPGTQMARTYESDVIKREGGQEQFITIKMNEPLRHAGYTFFQASFFEDPRSGVTSSTFAVVRNPADQWPLLACVIITAGLLLHFCQRLLRYLKGERARHGAGAPDPAPARPAGAGAARPQSEAAA
ncbi:MAG TPA: cytochrome c biogenesis protein ResB [Candidatus Sumerlaeota bacterium]|nr:cytochrome c biogenesis protein ResB [Candidatus Sumerlaeota bacterium]